MDEDEDDLDVFDALGLMPAGPITAKPRTGTNRAATAIPVATEAPAARKAAARFGRTQTPAPAVKDEVDARVAESSQSWNVFHLVETQNVWK